MRLILFDIDGTLLSAQGSGRAAKALAMREIYGTDAGVQNHPFGGKTDWQILEELLLGEGLSSEQIMATMPAYQDAFARHMADVITQFEVRAYPGALELVHYVRQNPELLAGIVTGNTAATTPIKLRAGGFDPNWFVAGAYGSESNDRRDLPRLALQRAEAYSKQTLKAEEVIVIGDTVNDIVAARALGAIAVGVLTGFEEAELLAASEPDYLLDDLTQFLDRVPL